jgi:hypothetical protein
MSKKKPYLSLMELLITVGAATFCFLQAGPLVNWGGPSVSDALIGRVDVDRRVPSTVGAGTLPLHATIVIGASALSTHMFIGSEVGDCIIVASG